MKTTISCLAVSFPNRGSTVKLEKMASKMEKLLFCVVILANFGGGPLQTVHTSMAGHVPKKNLTRKNGLGEGQKYYSA